MVWLLLPADGTVLIRLLELLGIICTRLGQTNGLVHEEYQAASDNALWTHASGTILCGEHCSVMGDSSAHSVSALLG
jgi:hypothetical protein